MKLDFLTLNKLTDSKANMRAARKEPDVADILPSVRARGVLVPLIVRPVLDADTFEVVAGRRRRRAAILLAEETGHAEPLPCAIIEPGDDAAALEASMLENMARLDPDEVKQWESFTALVKKGRSVDDIAATFGLPEPMIKRVLALGNLLPRVRDLYRREQIDGATIRHLTMATKTKQQEWLALYDDPDARVPTGAFLKSWLLGGQTIATTVALFDLADYPGLIVATLFGEDAYFGDPSVFWTAQNAAIEARRLAYLDAGWGDVTILEGADHFRAWEYEKTAKRKGGGVYIEVRASGEVVFHEGYCSTKAARKRERVEASGGAATTKTARPEVSSTMQADAAFFACIRDRQVLTRMVAEVAGEGVANANAGEKTKTLKGLVSAYLEGTGGRPRVERWVPRWMRFVPSAYTERGGVPTVAAHAKVEAARAALAGESAAQADQQSDDARQAA